MNQTQGLHVVTGAEPDLIFDITRQQKSFWIF